MKRVAWLVILLWIGVVVAQDDTTTMPTVDNLDTGAWNIIPVPEGVCSRGTDYYFAVRPGDAENLTIYFMGGGACWNTYTCAEGSGTFIDALPEVQGVPLGAGIFNFNNPQNPIADHSMVFVPYCTGDVHTGDAVQTYGDEAIQFNGYNNTTAVLEWVYANYPTPETVFVTGSSAGAYGAYYHAPSVIDAYPDADISVFGDAGLGIMPEEWNAIDDWNLTRHLPEGFAGTGEDNPFALPMLFTGNAERAPQVRFAQYSTYADEIQILYYLITGTGGIRSTWIENAQVAIDDLNTYPNYSSYIAPGDGHGILVNPGFYTLEVDGVRLRDWVAALIDGTQPDSVQCVDCD